MSVMVERTEVRLSLTEHELVALTTMTAGMASVNESQITEEAAIVGAIDLALTRLLEDFEVPDPEIRARLAPARDEMRRHWTRGNAGL
jgi:hypothetical protein